MHVWETGKKKPQKSETDCFVHSYFCRKLLELFYGYAEDAVFPEINNNPKPLLLLVQPH